jgi:hypothetical protein
VKKRPTKRNQPSDSTTQRLDAILELLRDLFIIAGKRAGLSRDQVRILLGVDTHRVSRVWRHISVERKET